MEREGGQEYSLCWEKIRKDIENASMDNCGGEQKRLHEDAYIHTMKEFTLIILLPEISQPMLTYDHAFMTSRVWLIGMLILTIIFLTTVSLKLEFAYPFPFQRRSQGREEGEAHWKRNGRGFKKLSADLTLTNPLESTVEIELQLLFYEVINQNQTYSCENWE